MYVLTPGTRVRFFSYIGADYILGMENDKDGWPHTVVKQIATDNNASTTFLIEAAEKGCFRLRLPQAVKGYSPAYLAWQPAYQQLRAAIALMDYTPPSNLRDWEDKAIAPSSDVTLFRVDPVKDGNWFALNDLNRQKVLDIDHGRGDRNTKVFGWPWNEGANQIWRTEAVS